MLVALVAAMALPAGASARLIHAESVLPPGQSGFVSLLGVADGSGSPHLYDQLSLYTGFRWKNAMLGQPGVSESPRTGVSILRDGYGVPAITGLTEDDMWFGAGYAVAQDRLFELDLFRNATQGTLSEIVGRSYLDDDRITREDLYTPAELDAMFARLPAALKARFRAYAAGINAWMTYVQSSPADLPGEYPVTATPLRPWAVRDSVAIGVYLARTIPTNADPHGLELVNAKALSLSGSKVFDTLLPLHPRRPSPTIPASEGRFPSQPGRTRQQERLAFRRSASLARTLPLPAPPTGGVGPAAAAGSGGSGGPSPSPSSPPSQRISAAGAALFPRFGGSSMFAVRAPGGHALLYNGPQLGFSAPEKLIELELHGPSGTLRGLSAPGAPVIGAGFNDKVAWGITTGASDGDDLYAERLVPGEPEQYVFNGEKRRMDCRDETLNFRSPPSDALAGRNPLDSGSVKTRLCRTVHGPVEARAGDIAYARRYAGWGRELETLEGLAEIGGAGSVAEIDKAVLKLTWNENVMAADSGGHIGFWHPGLMPLRPSGYDERLPYPGTGEAEWTGLLDRSKMPHVIDPKQGWLANWNTLPSADWSSGDGTARKRLDGPFFRGSRLAGLVAALAKDPSLAGVEQVVRAEGTVPQQLPLARPRLQRARLGATGDSAKVLDTILTWNGSYDEVGADGKVDAGLAAWTAFLDAAQERALKPLGPGARLLADDSNLDIVGGYHHGATYHFFDATHGQAFALGALDARGYRAAASDALALLTKRFGGADPAGWRQPRPLYKIAAQGAASPPDFPFFDRGTYEQLVELGP